MKASEVIEALCRHWPAESHLAIPEAPQSVTQGGRKIDLLVCAYWASRGYSLDAVEVKVSMSDWTRERKNPEKADWWYSHSDRFWVAVPADLAAKVEATLPEAWGLLAVNGTGTRIVVPAPKHPRQDLPWGTVLGIIRSASGAGANAIARAEARGRDEGERRARERGPDALTRQNLDALRARVKAYEEATGIPLGDRRWAGLSVPPERLGAVVRRVIESEDEVARAEEAVARALASLAQAHRRLAQFDAEDREGSPPTQ